MSRRSVLVYIAIVCLLGTAVPADAGLMTSVTNAVTSAPNGTIGASTSNRTYGWKFSLSETIEVVALGNYFLGDQNQSGENKAREVGIWVSTSTTPLTSTVVAPPSTTFVGYHFANLNTPITLTSGNEYLIGVALGVGDSFFADNNSVTVSSALIQGMSGIERIA